MKNFKKAIALCLSLMLILSFPVSASAVEPNDPTENVLIDECRTGSLTIYKYDITNAEKDGVWDSSYISTGRYDEDGVKNILGGTNRAGDNDNQSDLGNGEVSYGYAIKGVEFSYLRIADIVQFTESTADNRTDNHVEVLYGIDKVKGADFLKALGLENGAKRYTNADHLNENQYFYQSDVLIEALAAGLEANSTTVKTAMENYIAANGGTAMPLTDSYGKTEAHDLELGLYLLVETKVPEMVTSTTDPFLVSVPMTTINGTNAEDGGERWFYDITLYPKNLTGIPSLEKTLRENIQDTGKHDGSSTDITDGYAHTGTASAGDIVDYQIISTLPSITSEATYIDLGFVDTLSKGLSYTKGDIVLEIFKDADCTDLVTTWKEADGFFTAAYNTTDAGESVMTIDFTERGLAEINTSKAVYSSASNVNSGFSDCTLRITYTAKVDSDNSVLFGDAGNPNEVVMLWKRTSENYYDTLVDDTHIYTYGMDLTKLFSDGKRDFVEGWQEIHRIFRSSLKEQPDDDAPTRDFPDFTEGQTFHDVKVTICERFTAPPKPYTEDTLLSAMETAGKEDMPDDAERKGLGTPATRAAIIEKLVAAGFVERKGKSLIPTKDGINLVTVLPEPLTSPMLTAEWEQQLTAIARGEADPDTFTDGICDMVRELVRKYAGISDEGQKLFAPDREIIGCCPRCGKPVYEGKKNFACSDRSCSFVLWKQDRFWTSRKKELTKKMATDLLKRGRTAVKGMWSEKKGDTYDATVVLDDTGGKFVKFKMEFPKKRKPAAQ